MLSPRWHRGSGCCLALLSNAACSDVSPTTLRQPAASGAAGAQSSVAGTGSGGGAGGLAAAGVAGALASQGGSAGVGQGGAAGGAGTSEGGGGSAGNDGAGKVVLFGGADLSSWKSLAGGDATWTVSDGAFEVTPGSGDIETRQAFGDFKLHLEFWIPQTPSGNAEQDRGNSGVYLQGRYEVQVIDSFMHALEGANDCAAIYELKNADSNQALPPETWQTYEITFRAARFAVAEKTANARVSVVWNGVEVQHDIDVPGPTRLGDPEAPAPAGLRLQDHSHSVRYRNVWLQEL